MLVHFTQLVCTEIKKIEVASIGGRAPRSLTKSDLSLITSARYTELLGVVKDELDKLKAELEAKHIKFELIAGVVITGGGAQIEDLKECASNVFHCQVRIASPLNITGLTDYESSTIFNGGGTIAI